MCRKVFYSKDKSKLTTLYLIFTNIKNKMEASTNFTSDQLNKMTLTQLKDIAQTLDIQITETTPERNKLIKEITDCLKRQGTLMEEYESIVHTASEDESIESNLSESQKTNHTVTVRESSIHNGLSEELRFKLELKKMEMELEIEKERIEIEKERIASQERIEIARARSTNHVHSEIELELYKYRKYIPEFDSNHIEEFFMMFEKQAADYHFPENKMAVLLRSALTKGKALDVVLNLTVEEDNDYELIKNRILLSYALTPEKYRKIFRDFKKEPEQSHVDFLRIKEKHFDRWIRSKNVNGEYEKLRNLMLTEEFNNCVRNDVKIHLSDKGVENIKTAAVLADEYIIIHQHNRTFQPDKSKFKNQYAVVEKNAKCTDEYNKQKTDKQTTNSSMQKKPTCSFCKKDGHVRENCWSLQNRQSKEKKNIVLTCIATNPKTRLYQSDKKVTKAKTETFSVSHENTTESTMTCPDISKPRELQKLETMVFENSHLNSTVSKTDGTLATEVFTSCSNIEQVEEKDLIDTDLFKNFLPFITEGYVSSIDDELSERKIRILRDTGASTSLLLKDTIPISKSTYTGQNIALRGVDMATILVPLHRIQLKSEYYNGPVTIGVQTALPINGISLILGNDIAGDKVRPVSKEIHNPDRSETTDNSVCVLTRGMKKKPESDETTAQTENEPEIDLQATFLADILSGPSVETKGSNMSPRQLLTLEQEKDMDIEKLRKEAVSEKEVEKMNIGYYLKDGLLMRKWKERNTDNEDCNEIHQIVVPTVYRKDILHMAHDSPYAGHLGVNKTYDRILSYFYWPGLHKDTSSFCKSCHACQMVGKPNQTIPVAPLKPIPAFSEPFSHIIIDCVGPLPKTKAGHQYLFTIMCSATRFPEAIPMRSINADKISDALIGFFSRYGLPKTVQSDQGSNFTSKLFRQVLQRLGIRHAMSSAYHPQSQGALERYHQTLKNMLRTYCFEHGGDWDRGIPFVLFATREAVQESLGFSPFELVFGHAVRGPLKLLKETWLSSTEETGLLTYVENFKTRLYNALTLVKLNLLQAQSKMKAYYDTKAKTRSFNPGDQVLMLTPMIGQPMSAKYTGPYEVVAKLSELNYIVKTPDRRKSQRVCHINMLKPYIPRLVQSAIAPVNTVSKVEIELPKVERKLAESKLHNSESLKDLDNKLAHLPNCEKSSIKGLIFENIDLFNDIPRKTHLIRHDVIIDENVTPIKQHPYRVNPIQLEHIRKEVDYMLENDIITPSNSDWSSPCVLVPKPDGSLRFCVDYRRVNAVTKTDSYPIPRIDDLIDQVSDASFVTKIDLLTAYFQIPLTDRAQEVSSFTTPDGLYKFKVMPFGMVNAPASFQRLINSIIRDIPHCHAYLDDIVVYSDNFESHLKQLRLLFQKLQQANLTVNLAKSQFCHATIEYLGHIVGNGTVKPVGAKVTAIREFPIPETRKQLRSFLGMAGYYRKFCKNFSTIACPLTDLLKKNVKFRWTDECNRAFSKLKDLLSRSPVLITPNYNKPFKITVDACDTGMGAVISQEGDDSLEHPLCYYSQKFNPHERNYSTIEKELLGLILALKHFDFYLNGSPYPVDILTDHNPLVFLSRVKQNQRLIRWSLFLQSYNLNLAHIKGKDNVVADTLSRM